MGLAIRRSRYCFLWVVIQLGARSHNQNLFQHVLVVDVRMLRKSSTDHFEVNLTYVYIESNLGKLQNIVWRCLCRIKTLDMIDYLHLFSSDWPCNAWLGRQRTVNKPENSNFDIRIHNLNGGDRC